MNFLASDLPRGHLENLARRQHLWATWMDDHALVPIVDYFVHDLILELHILSQHVGSFLGTLDVIPSAKWFKLKMTPPPAMECSFPECTFITPASIPSYELVLKSLELHVSAAHIQSSTSPRQPVTKVEKPKRPVISCDMSESDWTFFEHKWSIYKRQSGIVGQQIVDEIWACLDADIDRLCMLQAEMSIPYLTCKVVVMKPRC